MESKKTPAKAEIKRMVSQLDDSQLIRFFQYLAELKAEQDAERNTEA